MVAISVPTVSGGCLKGGGKVIPLKGREKKKCKFFMGWWMLRHY